MGKTMVLSKYINDLKTKRDKYQVEIGATLMRRKAIFDTREIKQHFEKKKKDSTGAANLGTNRSWSFDETGSR